MIKQKKIECKIARAVARRVGSIVEQSTEADREQTVELLRMIFQKIVVRTNNANARAFVNTSDLHSTTIGMLLEIFWSGNATIDYVIENIFNVLRLNKLTRYGYRGA